MLSILILVLILLIVFVQAMYGFFSSLIMAICSLLCTLLAFSYYELLAGLLYKWQPSHADAGALIALTVLPLLLARFLIDKYLPGNIVSAVWVDRVGGGLMGLFTGLLLVGTLVIAIWMMPVSRGFMGCDLYEDTLEPKDSPFINAPGFTLALVENLSAGSMGGKPFAKTHDNLELELWGVRNRDGGARTDCLTNSASLVSLHDVTDLPYPGGEDENATFKVMAAQYPGVQAPSSKVYVARVSIKGDCRDADKWLRISLTQFRMLTSSGKGYFPVGYLACTDDWKVVSDTIGAMRINRLWERQANNLTADIIFRLPAGDAGGPVVPKTLSFRRVCQMPVKAKPVGELPSQDTALTMREVFGEVKIARTSGGVNALARPVTAAVVDKMPFTISFQSSGSNERQHVEALKGDASFIGDVVGPRIQNGVLKGSVSALDNLGGDDQRRNAYADAFFIPRGMKVVRLSCVPLKSDLFIGGLTRDLQFQPMVRVLGQGDLHAVGAWVKWSDGGADYYHMAYRDKPQENQEITNRTDPNILDVVKTYREKRKMASEFVVLFVVPENQKVVSFMLGGGERYGCESPLSTGDAPRIRRRRR